MKTRSIARARRDLMENEDFPHTSIPIRKAEWLSLSFYYMVLDREDDLPFIETDHPAGFNMILLHPNTHELFWGYSIEYEFDEVEHAKT